MPLGFGGVVFTSSSGGDIGGGRHYTRLRGPVLVGAPSNSDAPGGSFAGKSFPPHIVNVSTMRGDMLVSVISSFAQSVTLTSSALNVSTGTPTGLVYISMSTGAGGMIAAASTANAPTGLPGGANGAALVWDAAAMTLALYDPLSSAWLYPHTTSSGAGTVITWSASSS